MLTIQETADFRVPFRLQQDYRRRTLAAGTAHLLVQRAVRGPEHCGFDGVVRERAVDDLIAWMERGVVPQRQQQAGYRVAALDKKHDRKAFSCGVEPLDRYLREQAGQDARTRVAAPFVLCEGNRNAVLLIQHSPEGARKHPHGSALKARGDCCRTTSSPSWNGSPRCPRAKKCWRGSTAGRARR